MHNNEKMSYLLAGGISAIASLLFFRAILLSTPGGLLYPINPEILGTWGNVFVYLIICLLFITLFLAISLLVKHDKLMILKKLPSIKYGIFVIIVVICIGAGLFYGLLDEVWILSPLNILTIGSIIFLFSLVVLYYEKGNSIGKWFFLIIILIVAILLGFIAATPNTFGAGYEGTLYNVHHSSAYLDSIYGVLYARPYAGGITDQYGHYALFFYWPLKVFGATPLTVSIILGILFACSFICLMGAVHVLVESNYLKVLIALSAGGILASISALSIYWQTFPHRLIFPSVMILLIALSSKERLTAKGYLIGTLLSILSVLWNFESGIASTAAWIFFVIVNYYQYNGFDIKNAVKCLLKIIILFAICLFVPYFIVNLYNVLITGFDFEYLLSFKQFIGSMTEETYIDFLRTELKWGNLPYLYIMFTFLGCVALSLRSTSIITKEKTPSPIFVVSAATSMIGLVLLTMCINRTVAGPAAVYIFVAVVLGLIAYGMIWELKKFKRRGTHDLYDVSKVCICSLALMGIILMGVSAADVGENVDNKYSTGCYDYDNFVSFTDEIKADVPKDTIAAGFGTTAIYMELGWDKGYYKFDDSDELQDLLSSSDSFLIGHELFSHVDSMVYNLEIEFVYKGQFYRYYERV